VSAGRYDAAVIGAGVAGLAAAVALAEDGASVVLIERRAFAGGRAYSYPHPTLGEKIDSQHVIVGCCTNFIDLVRRAGAEETIRWYDELTFLEPRAGGLPVRSRLRPGGLPAPFHQTISFLRAPMLGLRDKAGIAAGLARFLRGYPATDEESFAAWLKRTGQTDRAIRHFWEPVIVGALNDSFANCSTKYAGKVFHESFLRSPGAGRLGIPAAPLSEFFTPIAEYARGLGVDVRFGCGVDGVARAEGGGWRVSCGADFIEADTVIVATNLAQTAQILGTAGSVEPSLAAALEVERFKSAPITTIHLWYDREITDLDHAVLLDTRIQWVFNKSRIRRWEAGRGSYLELVISASFAEIERSREQILGAALGELELFFPQVREAKVLKSAVLKEARATFSVTPGLDVHRPAQTTVYPNLFIAGDWTATEWPSTMEGAIRSGRLAAGAVTGERGRFLAAELPASGLMRLLSR
jgi:squalene-associated FAD-dependent desaturase